MSDDKTQDRAARWRTVKCRCQVCESVFDPRPIRYAIEAMVRCQYYHTWVVLDIEDMPIIDDTRHQDNTAHDATRAAFHQWWIYYGAALALRATKLHAEDARALFWIVWSDGADSEMRKGSSNGW